MIRTIKSLRLRLFTLILSPLIIMSIILGVWRYQEALNTAEDLFDRSLMSGALAVARDVGFSGGDTLSPSTRRMISDAAGGEIFYHVSGPGGIYITGYAYAPTGTRLDRETKDDIHYYDDDYRGQNVRVLRIREVSTFENFKGDTFVSVWQRVSDREKFAFQLAMKTIAALIVLLVTLAIVVWFGVQKGLFPLYDLQQAISMRSPDDLSVIKRRVPHEVKGIVETLNRLFSQVEKSMHAHQTFISDAAHQLRNPANAVQSMAEAVRDAPDEEERKKRIVELVQAAQESARIAQQLLSLDRLENDYSEAEIAVFDVCELVRSVCRDAAVSVMAASVDFEFEAPEEPIFINADPVYIAEAVKNLIDNAKTHGGASLTVISVVIEQEPERAIITVRDDGKGVQPADQDTAFRRFGQLEPGKGSGLGLAIALAVAEKYKGGLTINDVDRGASLSISFPRIAK